MDNHYRAHIGFWKERIRFGGQKFYFTSPSFAGESSITEYSFELKGSAYDFVRKISRADSLGGFVVILSGLLCTIQRYTGADTVYIDTPMFKLNVNDESAFGPVPIIVGLRNDMMVKEFIDEVRSTVQKSYTYQDFPFETIRLSEFGNSANAGTNILINCSAIHSNVLGNDSRYDLRIDIENDKRLILKFSGKRDWFTRSFIHRFAKHFDTIITSFMDLEVSLREVKMLSTQEEERLSAFNVASQVASRFKTVVDAFSFQVELHPENISVICGDKKITYNEVNNRSNQLARLLEASSKFKKGSVVGVWSDRSELIIIVLLAILKAGGVYLPLSTEAPEGRTTKIIQDANVKILFASFESAVQADKYGDVQILRMDMDIGQINLPQNNLIHMPGPDDLAYLIYTSGSTGLSKGVLIKHGGLLNVALDHVNEFAVTTQDSVMQFLSLSFDGAYLDIFMALLGGTALVIATKEEVQNTKKFIDCIARNRATILTVTPSYLNTLSRDRLESVRIIVSAGEAARPDDMAFYSSFKKAYNGYGPSEATINSCLYLLEPGKKYKNVPIGRPRSNKRVYILDNQFRLMPEGIVGELFIEGPDLALKYLNDEILTREKFIQNPFGPGRLYRTGDYGRWLSDGNIEFQGRRDDQIKINGHRVDLTEIERILLSHPSVKDGAIVAKAEADNSEKQLFAFYQVRGDHDDSNILEHLQRYLPRYMIPANFIRLTELPVTINGKIDKKALLLRCVLKGTDNIGPRTEVEEKLMQIWKEVLQVSDLGINSNFFEIGGQSLKAIQMLTRVFSAFNVGLDVDKVFINPTVYEFADLIGKELKRNYM